MWFGTAVDRRSSNMSGFVLALAVAGLLPGCTQDCTDMLGTYPPDEVVMTGVESVEVPYAAWGCPGYDLDSFDSERLVPVESQVTVDVSLREGSTVELRIDNESVSVDPAPVEGDNSWTLDLDADAGGVTVRLCSDDDACAIYVAGLEHVGDH